MSLEVSLGNIQFIYQNECYLSFSILAVLITDGGSTKPYLTKEQADLVHREQILVFGIGVSKKRGHLNETELKIISSDPDEKYTFTVENWGALDRIKEEVASRTCCKTNILYLIIFQNQTPLFIMASISL